MPWWSSHASNILGERKLKPDLGKSEAGRALLVSPTAAHVKLRKVREQRRDVLATIKASLSRWTWLTSYVARGLISYVAHGRMSTEEAHTLLDTAQLLWQLLFPCS